MKVLNNEIPNWIHDNNGMASVNNAGKYPDYRLFSACQIIVLKKHLYSGITGFSSWNLLQINGPRPRLSVSNELDASLINLYYYSTVDGSTKPCNAYDNEWLCSFFY